MTNLTSLPKCTGPNLSGCITKRGEYDDYKRGEYDDYKRGEYDD